MSVLGDNVATAFELVNSQREIIRRLRLDLAEAHQLVSKLEGLVVGNTKEETAKNIFLAARGTMKTEAVWALAEELYAKQNVVDASKPLPQGDGDPGSSS